MKIEKEPELLETMTARIPKFDSWLCVRKDGRELYYPLHFGKRDLGIPIPGVEVEARREEVMEVAQRIWEAPSLEELNAARLVFKRGRAR